MANTVIFFNNFINFINRRRITVQINQIAFKKKLSIFGFFNFAEFTSIDDEVENYALLYLFWALGITSKKLKNSFIDVVDIGASFENKIRMFLFL